MTAIELAQYLDINPKNISVNINRRDFLQFLIKDVEIDLKRLNELNDSFTFSIMTLKNSEQGILIKIYF